MLEALLTRLRVLLIAVAALAITPSLPAQAQSEAIDIEVFYRELEPYGRWIDHRRYGEVWVPEVERGWRPYTRGQWVYTEDFGWYWESEEPFGWAVYHYGRWYLDDDEGWVWVPGTEWAPAWVAWRWGEEEVGWAPLPPEAEWRDGELIGGSSFYESQRFAPLWAFVPMAMLTAPRVWSHVVSPRRNAYHFGRTRFIGFDRGRRSPYYSGGFDRRRWEGRTGRRIEVRRVVPVDRPFRDRFGGGRGDVRIYRPRVNAEPRRDGRPGWEPPREWRDRADRRPDFRREHDGGWQRDRRDGRDWRNDRPSRPDARPDDGRPRDRDVGRPRDGREGRDPRDGRDLRDGREGRDGRDVRDGRDGRDPREGRDRQPPRDRDLRDARPDPRPDLRPDGRPRPDREQPRDQPTSPGERELREGRPDGRTGRDRRPEPPIVDPTRDRPRDQPDLRQQPRTESPQPRREAPQPRQPDFRQGEPPRGGGGGRDLGQPQSPREVAPPPVRGGGGRGSEPASPSQQHTN